MLKEEGYEPAMLGLSLNKLQPVENMPAVARKLAKSSEGSHRKFMRQMEIWLLIDAPVYWWCEFDTYKVGVVRNSSSTMHRPCEHSRVAPGCLPDTIDAMEKAFDLYKAGAITIEDLKANLPMGILLTSVVSMNYENIRTMILDRRLHRLSAWRKFVKRVHSMVEHPDLLPELPDE